MVEPSHVALTRCFYCGEGNEILLHRRLGDVSKFQDKVTSMRPCNKCESYMHQGIILIGISSHHSGHGWHVKPDKGSQDDREGWMPNPYRTGAFMVVSEDFIRRVFNPPELVANIVRCRWSFIEHEAMFQLGLLNHAADQAGKPYRECACEPCKHHWLYEVKQSAETPNLSGETTPWCPICKKPATVAGPIITPDPKPAAEPPANPTPGPDPEDHSHHVDGNIV
jgi:hypothetical protein